MALLTTLANVKAIAIGEPRIQALHDSDPAVVLALADVALFVDEPEFGRYTEMAQRYLVAHVLAQALTEGEGRGAISSESIGGITRSWTMPNLNVKTAIATTQYGLKFLELRSMRVVPAVMVPPTA